MLGNTPTKPKKKQQSQSIYISRKSVTNLVRKKLPTPEPISKNSSPKKNIAVTAPDGDATHSKPKPKTEYGYDPSTSSGNIMKIASMNRSCTIPKPVPRRRPYDAPKSLFEDQNIVKKVRDTLMTPNKDRTTESIEELIKIFVDGKFFNQIPSDSHYMKKQIDVFQIEYHPVGNIVFQQGDFGEKYHIILSGNVDGYLKTHNTGFIDNEMDNNKLLFSLWNGQSFGEYAQLENKGRSCTIVANTDTELITLSNNEFRILVNDYKTDQLELILKLYEDCQLLRGITNEIKKSLAAKSKIKLYPANTVIHRQNEIPLNQIVVKTGGLKLLRKMQKNEIEGADNLRRLYPKEFEAFSDEIIMDLEDIGERGAVCDYELVFQVGMANTVLTSLPSELIFVSIYEIMAILSNQDIKAMQANVKKFPNNFDIIDSYLKNGTWARYKNCVVDNVFFAKRIHSKIRPEELMRNNSYKSPQNMSSQFNEIISPKYIVNQKILKKIETCGLINKKDIQCGTMTRSQQDRLKIDRSNGEKYRHTLFENGNKPNSNDLSFDADGNATNHDYFYEDDPVAFEKKSLKSGEHIDIEAGRLSQKHHKRNITLSTGFGKNSTSESRLIYNERPERRSYKSPIGNFRRDPSLFDPYKNESYSNCDGYYLPKVNKNQTCFNGFERIDEDPNSGEITEVDERKSGSIKNLNDQQFQKVNRIFGENHIGKNSQSTGNCNTSTPIKNQPLQTISEYAGKKSKMNKLGMNESSNSKEQLRMSADMELYKFSDGVTNSPLYTKRLELQNFQKQKFIDIDPKFISNVKQMQLRSYHGKKAAAVANQANPKPSGLLDWDKLKSLRKDEIIHDKVIKDVDERRSLREFQRQSKNFNSTIGTFSKEDYKNQTVTTTGYDKTVVTNNTSMPFLRATKMNLDLPVIDLRLDQDFATKPKKLLGQTLTDSVDKSEPNDKFVMTQDASSFNMMNLDRSIMKFASGMAGPDIRVSKEGASIRIDQNKLSPIRKKGSKRKIASNTDNDFFCQENELMTVEKHDLTADDNNYCTLKTKQKFENKIDNFGKALRGLSISSNRLLNQATQNIINLNAGISSARMSSYSSNRDSLSNIERSGHKKGNEINVNVKKSGFRDNSPENNKVSHSENQYKQIYENFKDNK